MRCNCGINPKNLTDEHLFAESRELKMLPSLYERYDEEAFNKGLIDEHGVSNKEGRT